MMARTMSPSFLLAIIATLSLCTAVAGHGFMAFPKARNVIANEKGTEYCHHCLSSGGPSTVSSLTPGGKFPSIETKTSAVRHAMCGEAANIPSSQRKYNPAPVPSIASLPVYSPGQAFDITVQITAHHRGHFEFRLCDVAKLSDPKTVTWECLDANVLQRVPVPGEVSPIDVNYPERYYLEPECSPRYNKTTFMKYRMPSTVTCERCVLQWWWVSANSCNPPGYARRSPQPAHVASGCNWWQNDLPACGTAYPEEFWNCADVRVAGTAVPAPAVGRTDPPAPRAAPKAPPAAPKPAPKAPPAKPAPKAAPKAAPKPAPKAPVPAPSTQTCAGNGYQCGGSGWTGTKCCQSGFKCFAYTATYSQCRSGTCPAGWLCAAEKSENMLTSAIDWVKSLA